MPDERHSKNRPSHGLGIVFGAALGLPAGIVFGFSLNNLALGLVLGLSIGIVFAVAFGANWSGKTRHESQSTDGCEDSDYAKRSNKN